MSTDAHIPPQALESEKAVLGGVLLENKSIHDLPARLKAEAFYMPSHRHIFEAMLVLLQRETPIDAVSVFDELKKAGHDIAARDILELSDFGMPRSIRHHANLVFETYRQRRTIELVRDNLCELKESPGRVDEIVSRLSSALGEDNGSKDSYSIADVMVAALKRLEESSDDALLIPTGFTALDEQIGGLERGELVTVGRQAKHGLNPALEQATIEKAVTMHGLRHTYASMLILLGRKIPEISRYLGHADVSITMRVYVHLLKPKKQDTMSDLERLIENG